MGYQPYSLEEKSKLTKKEQFRIPRLLLILIFFLDRTKFYEFLAEENIINKIRQQEKTERYSKPSPPPPCPPPKKISYQYSGARDKRSTNSTGPRFIAEDVFTVTATSPYERRMTAEREARIKRFIRAKKMMEDDINYPPVRPMGQLVTESYFWTGLPPDEITHAVPASQFNNKKKGKK